MILIILLIALVLRLVNLNQSLWLDEAININVTSSLDFRSLIFNYSLGDFHPPLYHLLLRSWILSFGSSEIAARSLSVLLGVGSVITTYLIGKKLYDKKTALIAATLLSTAPLSIYYSQEARMYMLAAFLTTLSVYFFVSILARDTIHSWIGFVISTTLLLYTDYLPYLMILVYVAYLFFNRKKISRPTLRSFLPATLLIVILLIPWLTVFPKQLETGLSAAAASPAWAQVVGAANLKSLLVTFVKFTIGRVSHNNDSIYALLFLPVAVSVCLLFLLSLFRISPRRSFLFFWFFLPILAAFTLSTAVPIFAYFRLIFVLPAFYLILSSAITTINWSFSTRFLLSIALIINLTSATIYFINPKFQRENWREATKYIHDNSTPNTIVLFESDYSIGPFDYYNKSKVQAFGALDSFNPDYEKVKGKIVDFTEGKNKVFLFQYLAEITDPQGLVYKELTMNGFVNSQTRDFEGVGFVYEFKR